MSEIVPIEKRLSTLIGCHPFFVAMDQDITEDGVAIMEEAVIAIQTLREINSQLVKDYNAQNRRLYAAEGALKGYTEATGEIGDRTRRLADAADAFGRYLHDGSDYIAVPSALVYDIRKLVGLVLGGLSKGK